MNPIYRSKAKVMLLLLGSFGFVALGVFLIWRFDRESGADSMDTIIGIASIVIFGLLGFLWLLKLFDKRPVLEFLSEGLLVPEIAATPIFWRDITGVRLVVMRRQPLICMTLSSAAEQSLSFTRTARYTRGANRLLGFDGWWLTGVGLTVPPADVVRMIDDRARHTRDAGSGRT